MYKSDINFNLYKTFYDVATYGSISKAAVVNYTSQPAISRSIKSLEEQLNTKLFHRTKKGIELTDKQLEQFEKYYELLVEWNEKMNLTAITNKEDVYLKHFYDSLTP
jgi:DNA-binding transcriptional LysR family regulator